MGFNKRKPGYFIVACRGWSASLWLANCFNLHEQVICSHNVSLVTDLLLSGWTSEKNHSIPTSEKLIRKVLEKNNLDDEGMDCLHSSISEILSDYFRASASVEAFFNILRLTGDADFFGSVHTYRLCDFGQMELLEENTFQFCYANLLRHPLNTVLSAAAEMKKNIESFALETVKNKFQQIETAYPQIKNIMGEEAKTQENLAFILGCIALNGIAEDLHKIPLEGNILMEKLTRDRDYYADTLTLLTEGRMPISEEYLDQVFQTYSLNKHRDNHQEPAIAFSELQEWKKDSFRFFYHGSGIHDTMMKLGYELNFL